MSEKPSGVPDEINIDKNINERNIPDEQKVSEEESLGLDEEKETSARILTLEERGLLEKETKITILEDRPELLYCFGASSPLYYIESIKDLEFFKKMINEDKGVLFMLGNPNAKELPTVDELIDKIIKRRGLVEEMLEKLGHLKMNRAVMGKLYFNRMEKDNLSIEQRELVSSLGHFNGYNSCESFAPEQKGGNRIEILSPLKLREPFKMGLALEECSARWLEPYGRSKFNFSSEGFDKENPLLLLEDLNILKKAITEEGNRSFIQETIDDHFSGDIVAFQKRWREYYENWWPDEFIVMKDSIDKTKEWLKSQKDKK